MTDPRRLRRPPGRVARTDLLPGAPSAAAMRNGRDEYVGWTPIESGNGRSRVAWTPPPQLANPLGQAHGGFLGVIVDDVCGMAFASLLTEFRPFPTQSMQLEYHRPIMVGETVECRGTVVRVGRRSRSSTPWSWAPRASCGPGAPPRSPPTSRARPWPTGAAARFTASTSAPDHRPTTARPKGEHDGLHPRRDRHRVRQVPEGGRARVRATGDWTEWSECFTEDAQYYEHHYGRFEGRQQILEWISTTMAEPINCDMIDFPADWYVIDEERGWVICAIWNVMPRPRRRQRPPRDQLDEAALRGQRAVLLRGGHLQPGRVRRHDQGLARARRSAMAEAGG